MSIKSGRLDIQVIVEHTVTCRQATLMLSSAADAQLGALG